MLYLKVRKRDGEIERAGEQMLLGRVALGASSSLLRRGLVL